MKKIFFLLFILSSLASCASATKKSDKFDTVNKSENIEEILDHAEANSTLSGRKILEASRSMISNKEIVVGGCWHYINAVYDRVGYSANLRKTVYKSKFNGPYIEPESIQPGDWLYFVNHTFSESEHSAIFVAWTDEEKKEALMVNYVGGRKKKPGTYKKFILDNIYNVIRVVD